MFGLLHASTHNTIMAKLSTKDMLAAVAALSVPQPVSKHVSCLTSPRTHTPRSNSGGAASTTASDAFKQAAIAVSKKAPKGRAKPAAQQHHQKQPRQTAAAAAAAPAQAHSPSLWPTDGALDMIKSMIALDAAATGVSNITHNGLGHTLHAHTNVIQLHRTAPPSSPPLTAPTAAAVVANLASKIHNKTIDKRQSLLSSMDHDLYKELANKAALSQSEQVALQALQQRVAKEQVCGVDN